MASTAASPHNFCFWPDTAWWVSSATKSRVKTWPLVICERGGDFISDVMVEMNQFWSSDYGFFQVVLIWLNKMWKWWKSRVYSDWLHLDGIVAWNLIYTYMTSTLSHCAYLLDGLSPTTWNLPVWFNVVSYYDREIPKVSEKCYLPRQLHTHHAHTHKLIPRTNSWNLSFLWDRNISLALSRFGGN